jgi:hypothetical protein
MLGLATTDWALLCIAAYVAIAALVRLMRHRRDELLNKLRSEFAAQRERPSAKEQKEKKAA